MSFKGRPDWSQMLASAGGAVFASYEEPGRGWALPVGLGLAAGPGGRPAFALELIRLDGGAAGPEVRGLLTIRFAAGYDLAARQEALFAALPEVKLAPLAPTAGFVRFQPAGALELPEELVTPRKLMWAGAGNLTLAAPVGSSATKLLRDAVEGGLAPATAVAEVEAQGLTSRSPAVARLDAGMLVAPLTAAIANGGLTLKAVVTALDGLGDALALDGLPAPDARPVALTALAERLIGRFGALAPAMEPGGEAVFALDFAALKDHRIDWPLDAPALVPRGVVLAADPLAAARQALADGFTLTHEAPVVAVETGLHVISVFANLPDHRVGAIALGAELRAPPFLPDRPQTIAASASFHDGETVATVPMRLSAREPVAFTCQGFAFIVSDGAAERLTGAAFPHEGAHLTLSPDDFPVGFVRIEATAGLLVLASLALVCAGQRGGKAWQAHATLDKGTASVAIAVPREVTGGALSVHATARDGGRVIALDDLALADCLLDLSTFPSAGPAVAQIVCDFDDDAGVAAIQCVPEDRADDAAAIGLVRLTPAQPAREWRWLVKDPFRDGFLWRWLALPGAAPPPWSDRIDPASGLLALKSSAAPTRSVGVT